MASDLPLAMAGATTLMSLSLLACLRDPLAAVTNESETMDTTDTGTSLPICEQFEFGEQHLGDNFGECWSAVTADACAAASAGRSSPCSFVMAHRIECSDDGTACRTSEPVFVACQDPTECEASPDLFVCARSSSGDWQTIMQLLAPACPIYSTYPCTPPVGFELESLASCE